jgi:hypothetical protein
MENYRKIGVVGMERNYRKFGVVEISIEIVQTL